MLSRQERQKAHVARAGVPEAGEAVLEHRRQQLPAVRRPRAAHAGVPTRAPLVRRHPPRRRRPEEVPAAVHTKGATSVSIDLWVWHAVLQHVLAAWPVPTAGAYAEGSSTAPAPKRGSLTCTPVGSLHVQRLLARL